MLAATSSSISAPSRTGKAHRAEWLVVLAGVASLGALADAYGQNASAPAAPDQQNSQDAAQGALDRENAGYEAFAQRAMPPLPPDAPKPSTDPQNLEGTWFHRDLLEKWIARTMYEKVVPMNAAAKQTLARREASSKAGKPIANASARCLPTGHPWQLDLNFPFTIVQTPTEIYFLFEEFHGVWKVRMNQPHRPPGREREYMGDSVGVWDGGTLVVDTVGFKEPMWADVAGTPLSRDVRMTHRIRKIDEGGAALEIITTIDDPALYNAKWSMVRTFAWRPDKAVFAEYNCEQQVGGPDGIAAYGLVEE